MWFDFFLERSYGFDADDRKLACHRKVKRPSPRALIAAERKMQLIYRPQIHSVPLNALSSQNALTPISSGGAWGHRPLNQSRWYGPFPFPARFSR